MKRILTVVVSIVCFLCLAGSASAQLDGSCFAPHYSTYVTESLGSDNASIIQTVEVSGYTQALNPAVWAGPNTGYIYPCQSETSQMQNSTHTSSITNYIGGIGGVYSQGPVPAFSYDDYIVSVTTPAADGVVLSTSTEGKVDCIVAGTIFSTSFNWNVEIAKTRTSRTGPGPDSSHQAVTPYCTAATTPPDYNPNYAWTSTVSLFYMEKAVCYKAPAAPGGDVCAGTSTTVEVSPQPEYSCTKNF